MVTPDETLELAAHRATSEETIIDLTTNVKSFILHFLSSLKIARSHLKQLSQLQF